MILKKLYGLKKHLLDLVKLSDMNKLPKVLLLSGKKGQGKYTLVHHLMAYILDKNNYNLNEAMIDETNRLYISINENYNPSVMYYNCCDNNMKIEDIRSLRLKLQKSSINNLNRFIIFDDVERLNENCVNALLKTIEEPSETNYFILINNQSQNLLKTLKSRSIEVMFFLNKSEKNEIINKLIFNLKIEKKINLNNSTLTPGNYLKYNKLILDEKIDNNDELIVNIEKLLRLNKTKKNIEYLNFAIYLINQYYYIKSKNKTNINYCNDNRINIIRKVHELNRLNLNHKNLIAEIENFI